jgi:hypothetical protein
LTLTVAVLPNILYLGHGDHHADLRDPAQAEEHAAHCHLGPSKCSGQPGAVTATWADSDVWRLNPSGFLFVSEASPPVSPSDGPSFKSSPPPRYG